MTTPRLRTLAVHGDYAIKQTNGSGVLVACHATCGGDDTQWLPTSAIEEEKYCNECSASCRIFGSMYKESFHYVTSGLLADDLVRDFASYWLDIPVDRVEVSINER